MTESAPYPTARGVESAIKDAAKKATRNDPSLTVGKRVELEHFNRFLSRIFSEGENSEWVLKGGTSILARVAATRTTRDIDLYRAGSTLDQALDDLVRLAGIDLGDHFRFEYVGHSVTLGTDTQPYTDGYRVKFNVFVGLSPRGTLQVDLVVGANITDEVVEATAATALDVPRLITHTYRLYPVVDQIADKVCATMSRYNEKTSSREKDLVDLVVFATTHDIGGDALRVAILTEVRRRRMRPFTQFEVPEAWGAGYSKLSRSVPYCADYRTVDAASGLAARLIDPALSGTADDKVWSHASLSWA